MRPALLISAVLAVLPISASAKHTGYDLAPAALAGVDSRGGGRAARSTPPAGLLVIKSNAEYPRYRSALGDGVEHPTGSACQGDGVEPSPKEASVNRLPRSVWTSRSTRSCCMEWDVAGHVLFRKRLAIRAGAWQP